jgi:hypothetical protein
MAAACMGEQILRARGVLGPDFPHGLQGAQSFGYNLGVEFLSIWYLSVNCLRNCHTVSQDGGIILYSHQ